jgi:hypothetical protein
VHAPRVAPENGESTLSLTSVVIHTSSAGFLLAKSLPFQIAELRRPPAPGYGTAAALPAADQLAGGPPAPPPRLLTA